MKDGSLSNRVRRTVLAGSIIGSLAIASPLATAATVTSCDDSATAATTAGALRYEIAHAASGDTIDFNLPPTCNSTITLTTGVIPVTQDSLTLQSSGSRVTLQKYAGATTQTGMLDHQGTGTLTLSNLFFLGGKYDGPQAKGGCVRSTGSVRTQNAYFRTCQAVIGNPGGNPLSGRIALGGAIYAAGDLYMVSSTIANSTAEGPGHNDAKCGGADVHGKLTLLNSTIAGNEAHGYVAYGGGACAGKGALIVGSTISGNISMTSTAAIVPPFPASVGGLFVVSPEANSGNYQLLMVNSTVSDNYSFAQGAGIYSNVPTFVFNSTVASNTAKTLFYSLDPTQASGLALGGVHDNLLVSSVFSGNTVGGIERDVSVYRTPTLSATVTGQANLVAASDQASSLPADTIFGKCARLGPLRANGGPTLTRALLSGSPAINAGANPGVGLGPLGFDQRGAPSVRESAAGLPDIGAYEVQQDDILFNTGFEDCS